MKLIPIYIQSSECMKFYFYTGNTPSHSAVTAQGPLIEIYFISSSFDFLLDSKKNKQISKQFVSF
jgi:hypothetical protein